MTTGQYLLAFAGMGLQLFFFYLVLFLLAARRKGGKQGPAAHH